ncbi:MAG: SAM-dependent chlorinase/fluorinase [Dehalococcoidia bacterium]|nr:SAM-dependent chlorinase/fluorinase [Dehalococcoidia bacterium]
MAAPPPIITLTTDFGVRDPYVGVMKGVILGINPRATIVDLSHEVEPQAIAQGAFIIGSSHRFFPSGSIHVVVVDPGVGTSRRAVLLVTPTARFLGPDNGVFTHVARAGYADGEGLAPGYEAYEMSNRGLWLGPPSDTFHGRDVFAPVAAHLSLGVPDREVGPRLSRLTLLPQATPAWDGPVLEGSVVHVDRYGNLITDIPGSLLRGVEGLVFRVRGRPIHGLSRSYSEAGSLLAIVGSTATLEVAVRNGSAAEALGAGVGDPVRAEAPLLSGPG